VPIIFFDPKALLLLINLKLGRCLAAVDQAAAAAQTASAGMGSSLFPAPFGLLQ
jgi:hypothetical protein